MMLLRMAFLAPAIVDFILAILTIYRMDGVVDDSLVPRGQFAATAFCWTILLLQGMRKPVQRAWILLPTALVIGCIGAAFLWGYMAGTVSVARLALAVGLSGTLIGLCLAGFKYARGHHHRPESEA